MMRAEEWFSLALRVIGVVNFLYGLVQLLDFALLRLGYFHYPDTSPAYFFIVGSAYTVVGIYLMRGAQFIVNFVYPAERVEEDDDQTEVESKQP